MKKLSLAAVGAAMILSLTCLASAQGASSRDDSIKVACEVYVEQVGITAYPGYCQCQNDYFAKLLTDEDWEEYSFDYAALSARISSRRYTEPYSYDRYIQITDSECRKCRDNGFRGCLLDDNRTPSAKAYQRILSDIHDGQFSRITRNILYKSFVTDYVSAYSAFCFTNIDTRNATDFVTITTTWSSFFGSRVQTGRDESFVRIEGEFANTYEAYIDDVGLRQAGDFFADTFKHLEDGTLPSITDGGILNQTLFAVSFMRSHMGNKCTAPETVQTYENLKRYHQNLQPGVPSQSLLERSQYAKAQAEKYDRIRASVPASIERADAVWRVEKERQDALPKGFLACPVEESLAKANRLADPLYQSGETLPSFNNVWQGELGEHKIELAIWSRQGRRPQSGGVGFAYLPEADCLLSAHANPLRPGFGTKQQSFRGNQYPYLSLTVVSQQTRPRNCQALVIDDFGKEVHFFKASGYFSYQPESQAIAWRPTGTSLGRATPQTCSANVGNFRKTALSPEFANFLRRFSGPPVTRRNQRRRATEQQELEAFISQHSQ